MKWISAALLAVFVLASGGCKVVKNEDVYKQSLSDLAAWKKASDTTATTDSEEYKIGKAAVNKWLDDKAAAAKSAGDSWWVFKQVDMTIDADTRNKATTALGGKRGIVDEVVAALLKQYEEAKKRRGTEGETVSKTLLDQKWTK